MSQPTAVGKGLRGKSPHAVLSVSTCKRICKDAQRAGLSPAAGCGAAEAPHLSLHLSSHLFHIFSTLAVLRGVLLGVFCGFSPYAGFLWICAALSYRWVGIKKSLKGGPSATKKVIVGVISRVLYPFGCQSFN